MFVIAQYMLSVSTVFPRHPAKAVVCQLFQLLYLPGPRPWQMSSNSFLPSHNSLYLPGIRPCQMSLTPSCLLITPSTSRSSVRVKCPLTPSCLLITPSTSRASSRGKCPLTPSFLLITLSTSRASVRVKCPLTPSAFS